MAGHEVFGARSSAVGRPHGALTGRSFAFGGVGVLLSLLIAAVLAISAQAQSVGLGTTDSFAVLGGTTVTNTGPSVISGDLGVSPGTDVTGFPPGTVSGGAIHGERRRRPSSAARSHDCLQRRGRAQLNHHGVCRPRGPHADSRGLHVRDITGPERGPDS